jgi:ABC-type phosphate transport system substrate-binding protein
MFALRRCRTIEWQFAKAKVLGSAANGPNTSSSMHAQSEVNSAAARNLIKVGGSSTLLPLYSPRPQICNKFQPSFALQRTA